MKKLIKIFLFAAVVFTIAVNAEMPTESPVRHGDGYRIEVDGVFTSDKFNTYRKALHTLQETQIANPDSVVRLIPDWYETVTLKSTGGGTTPDPDPTEPPPPVTDVTCDKVISPGENINTAFDLINDGEVLCLNDGVYVQTVTVPSNKTLAAVNINKAVIDGQGTEGTDWGGRGLLMMSGSNSTVIGLKVTRAGGELGAVNACSIAGTNNTMKLTSCSHGGAYKHAKPLAIGGTGHLIEDSWAFGKGRYTVSCYIASNITFRRVVARWDSTTPNEPTEPNAAFSNYSCENTIWENTISLDYGKPVTEMVHCADMCLSSTGNPDTYGNLNLKFLGNIIYNHNPDTSNNRAFSGMGKSGSQHGYVTIKDMWIKDMGGGIRFDYPTYTDGMVLENCTTINVQKNGKDYDGIVPGTSNTPLVCNDQADVKNRYVDGVKTDQPLWPWPNEEIIKADMCATGERQSDWCNTNLTLTEYIGVN